MENTKMVSPKDLVTIEVRKKFFAKGDTTKPFTFIDTSQFSMSLYASKTGNHRLFYDDEAVSSVAFGYHGVKTTNANNYAFVDISRNN